MNEHSPLHTLTDEEKFCLEGCGNYAQYHLMRNNFEAENCVFCNLDRTRNEVLFEHRDIMLWKVPASLGKKRPLEHHILIVPKRHVRFEADLTEGEMISKLHALRYARDVLGYTGGLNHAREGDMRNNAGTVPHLHFNLFQPNCTAEVRVPVYKDPTDRVENQARAKRFSFLYDEGMTPEKFELLIERGDYRQDGQIVPRLGHTEC